MMLSCEFVCLPFEIRDSFSGRYGCNYANFSLKGLCLIEFALPRFISRFLFYLVAEKSVYLKLHKFKD